MSRQHGRLGAITIVYMLALVATSAMLAFATGADAAHPHDSDTNLGSDVLQAGVKTEQKHMLPAIKMKLLGGRVLSWVGREAYITQLYAKGRKWHSPYYKLAGLPKEVGGTVPFVQHTTNMVFATIEPGLGSAQVYLARLPWARSAR